MGDVKAVEESWAWKEMVGMGAGRWGGGSVQTMYENA